MAKWSYQYCEQTILDEAIISRYKLQLKEKMGIRNMKVEKILWQLVL